MIGLGIGLKFGGAPIGNSAEALAWKTNIEANGGTISQALLNIFDQNFFIPAKANGNILTELDRLNIYCGLVGYEIAARTNLIKNAHYVTPVSSPTFDNNGYKSSGTSYLNLNYNAKTQGVKLTLNSATIFSIIKSPLFSSTKRVMGAADITANFQLVLARNSGNLSGAVNSSATSTNTNTTTGNVLVGGKRSSSLNQDIIINSNVVNTVAASTDLPNLSQFELCINYNGSPLGAYDDMSHMCSGHGSSNLDLSALRTILNNLFTALGV